MSNKNKLILIISFFLIIFLIVFYYINIVIKNNDEIKEIDSNNKELNTNLDVSIIESEEIIAVILNEDNEEEIKEELEEELEETIEEENSNPEIEEENNITVPTNAIPSTEVNEKNTYYIKVNNLANVVTVYNKDSEGNYTVPYKSFICSTGTATPESGTYKTDYKYRWLGLFGDVYGQYCTRIVGNILFHSVPYLEKENEGSLEYWEYDKLRNLGISRMYKINGGGCKMDI